MSRASQANRLLGRLLGPDGPELSCEGCFAELDRYVELELAGAPADRRIPGMAAHLQGCPACREDHDSLLAFVRSQPPEESPGDGGRPS